MFFQTKKTVLHLFLSGFIETASINVLKKVILIFTFKKTNTLYEHYKIKIKQKNKRTGVFLWHKIFKVSIDKDIFELKFFL